MEEWFERLWWRVCGNNIYCGGWVLHSYLEKEVERLFNSGIIDNYDDKNLIIAIEEIKKELRVIPLTNRRK